MDMAISEWPPGQGQHMSRPCDNAPDAPPFAPCPCILPCASCLAGWHFLIVTRLSALPTGLIGLRSTLSFPSLHPLSPAQSSLAPQLALVSA
eukprot:364906-Chlamydomonas_euryale.AAC.6